MGNISKDTSDEYMTTENVCAMYHISRRTVYRWVERGLLRAVKVGKRLYFRPEDVVNLGKVIDYEQ